MGRGAKYLISLNQKQPFMGMFSLNSESYTLSLHKILILIFHNDREKILIPLDETIGSRNNIKRDND